MTLKELLWDHRYYKSIGGSRCLLSFLFHYYLGKWKGLYGQEGEPGSDKEVE